MILYYTIFNNNSYCSVNTEAVAAVVLGSHYNLYSDLIIRDEDNDWVSKLYEIGCIHEQSDRSLWGLACSESEFIDMLENLDIQVERSETVTKWVLDNIDGITQSDILEGYELVEDMPMYVSESAVARVNLAELLGDLEDFDED